MHGLKRNFLLILPDQQTAGAMICAGNPWLRTPNMDRLAARGVRFETVYCTNPLCVPSRVSLMTGRMPSEAGVPYNMRTQSGVVRGTTIGRWFSDHGYHCGYAGKWHLVIPPAETDTHGFSWMRCVKDHAVDSEIPQACAEFLQQSHDRPFVLTAMFVNPHNICEWARSDKLPEGEVGEAPTRDLPPLPDNFQIAPDEPSILRECVHSRHPKAYPTRNWDDETWRHYRWAYYRMVEKVDAEIGRLLDALDASDHAANTTVIFSIDHGDGMGAHHWNQKQALFDECVRVPLIVSGPAIREGAVDDTNLVSLNLDVFPTLCDLAEVQAPDDLPGRSLRPLLETGTGLAREAIFAETEFCTFGSSLGIRGHMVRTRYFKYVTYSEGMNREQLFDLAQDPGETLNLTQAPEHQETLSKHRILLEKSRGRLLSR